MENTDESTVHRSFRVPVELDEHIQNTEEHKYLKDKYFAVLRRGLGMSAEHRVEHTENTRKDWGEEIRVLQEQIETLQHTMKQFHNQNKSLQGKLKALEEASGFI